MPRQGAMLGSGVRIADRRGLPLSPMRRLPPTASPIPTPAPAPIGARSPPARARTPPASTRAAYPAYVLQTGLCRGRGLHRRSEVDGRHRRRAADHGGTGDRRRGQSRLQVRHGFPPWIVSRPPPMENAARQNLVPLALPHGIAGLPPEQWIAASLASLDSAPQAATLRCAKSRRAALASKLHRDTIAHRPTTYRLSGAGPPGG